MQEIIEEIIRAEKKAEKLIQEARDRQREQSMTVEREVHEKIQQARSASQKRILDGAAKDREKAKEDHKEAIIRMKKEDKEFSRESEKKLKGTIEKIVKLLITPEFEKD
jgi:vacuolar-type H+-ATPase subunit H